MAVPGDREPAKASKRKATAPRPDEMSPQVCEFLTAIDDYRRGNMRSFLSFQEILEVLRGLGYSHVESLRDETAMDELAQAVEEYKQANERLFPSWSEIFTVAVKIGWER